MTTTDIESRLANLEQELARLKADRAPATTAKPHPIHALEKIHGTFENDAAFQEAMRLGRQWRQSPRPKARQRKLKAKRK